MHIKNCENCKLVNGGRQMSPINSIKDNILCPNPLRNEMNMELKKRYIQAKAGSLC